MRDMVRISAVATAAAEGMNDVASRAMLPGVIVALRASEKSKTPRSTPVY